MQGPFIDFLRIVQDHRLLCNICGEGRLLWRIFRSLTSTLQMPNSPLHACDTKFLVKREHCHAAGISGPCDIQSCSRLTLLLKYEFREVILGSDDAHIYLCSFYVKVIFIYQFHT